MHRLYAIYPKYESLPISYTENNKHVTIVDITLASCESIVLSGILDSGYLLLRISAHSLRASRAMALILNFVGEDITKKLGSWSSAT